MLREAELFVMAEQMLTEVLGRIRDHDLDMRLPAITGVTGDRPGSMATVVDRHLRDDASVPPVLAGHAGGHDEPLPTTNGARQAAVVRLANEAMAAARNIDTDLEVHTPTGVLPVAEFLLERTVVRSLVAHYVAAYLGSTACPLPEELARPLWELTAPTADAWRRTGLFGPPMPIPDRASWRDTFLLTAGHLPHPLGH